MIKILFITPANTIGGAELSLVETIKYLKTIHISTEVLMPPTKDNDLGALMEPICDKVWYHRLAGWPQKKSIKNWKYSLVRALREEKAVRYIRKIITSSRIQLVHTNTVHTRVGAIAAKKESIPHVLHLREITGQGEEAYVHLFGQQNTQKFKAKWGHNQVLLANSEYCLQKNKDYFSGDIEEVIYNPIPNLLPATTADVLASEVVVAMIANVSSRGKRHEEFVEIAAQYLKKYNDANVIFKIYGKLPEAADPYYKKLRQLILDFGLKTRIIFEGTVNQNIIYANISLLIHPFPFEAFGRIYIEAMQSGIPIIAARGGGASELIKDGKDGLLYEPGNINQAVGYLNQLVGVSNFKKKLINNGMEKAKKFVPEIVLSELPNLYNRALSNND